MDCCSSQISLIGSSQVLYSILSLLLFSLSLSLSYWLSDLSLRFLLMSFNPSSPQLVRGYRWYQGFFGLLSGEEICITEGTFLDLGLGVNWYQVSQLSSKEEWSTGGSLPLIGELMERGYKYPLLSLSLLLLSLRCLQLCSSTSLDSKFIFLICLDLLFLNSSASLWNLHRISSLFLSSAFFLSMILDMIFPWMFPQGQCSIWFWIIAEFSNNISSLSLFLRILLDYCCRRIPSASAALIRRWPGISLPGQGRIFITMDWFLLPGEWGDGFYTLSLWLLGQYP